METSEKTLCKDGPKPRRNVLRNLVRRLSSGGDHGRASRREEHGATVSVSGCSGSSGRASHSRRTSREPSPTNNLATIVGNDVNTLDEAAALGTTGIPCTSQDWRRLVGSIRRKVRRKAPNSRTTINETNLHDVGKNDDFLKATMRIFLVVSPPMARVQVRFFFLPTH